MNGWNSKFSFSPHFLSSSGYFCTVLKHFPKLFKPQNKAILHQKNFQVLFIFLQWFADPRPSTRGPQFAKCWNRQDNNNTRSGLIIMFIGRSWCTSTSLINLCHLFIVYLSLKMSFCSLSNHPAKSLTKLSCWL